MGQPTTGDISQGPTPRHGPVVSSIDGEIGQGLSPTIMEDNRLLLLEAEGDGAGGSRSVGQSGGGRFIEKRASPSAADVDAVDTSGVLSTQITGHIAILSVAGEGRESCCDSGQWIR